MDGLTKASSGYHFNATNVTAERIENFPMDEMGEDLDSRAPYTSAVFTELLRTSHQRK